METISAATHAPRAAQGARRRGQAASLEMTLAMFCALLLLFGSMKVMIWIVERLVTRQQDYEATRVNATLGAYNWNDTATAMKLNMFNE